MSEPRDVEGDEPTEVADAPPEIPHHGRDERWRLVLGGPAEGPLGGCQSAAARGMDAALAALYDADEGPPERGRARRARLGGSAPKVARWLGDIRGYFPQTVVRVMQEDALERLGLQQMLLEPELLEAVEPDVHLVATLLTLSKMMRSEARAAARGLVRRLVDDIERRLRSRLEQAVRGALNRATRGKRPRSTAEIDWHRTIRKNLRHYQREQKTLVVETLVGYARRRSALKDVILCIDQSGSMAASVVYAGIFGAVLASLEALTTRVVVFDTEVVDLTDVSPDPVDLLFGTQLGGGTDIGRALTYCQQLVTRPRDTVLVLVSDLYEGGDRGALVRRAAELVHAGVTVVALLALSDDGTPSFDHEIARQLAALGIPAFGCTPDRFPDLMAAALGREDLALWAARNDLVTAAPTGPAGL